MFRYDRVIILKTIEQESETLSGGKELAIFETGGVSRSIIRRSGDLLSARKNLVKLVSAYAMTFAFPNWR